MHVNHMKAERLSQNLTLTALTMKTGIASSDLSAVENGTRPAFPSWRVRIAAALGKSEAELFPPQIIKIFNDESSFDPRQAGEESRFKRELTELELAEAEVEQAGARALSVSRKRLLPGV